MSAKLYIGTAGWSYDDWWGIIYPPTKKKGFDELKFLGKFFNVLEINTTFYRIPSRRQTESWARRWKELVIGASKFWFIVKLYQEFTHVRESFDAAEITAFCEALEPLAEHNLLACILIQFPWSFRFKPENFYWLKHLTREFATFPLAIEVRHSSWLCQEYFDFLRQNQITFVNIDQPIFRDSVKPAEYVFTESSYFRFHGRNKQNWFKEDVGPDERYNYLYSGEELGEWSPRIQHVQQLCERVYVIFNNHFQAKAVCNALQIKAALTGLKFDLPESLLNAYPQLNALARKTTCVKNQRDLFK